MQEIAVDIVSVALLVFLFGALTWSRSDDRLRCWFAGWICILAHFFAEFWQPQSNWARSLQVCLTIDSLILAGIFFVISTMILFEGRRAGVRLGGFLAVSTLLCVTYALLGGANPWLLIPMVIGRQALGITLAARSRRNRARTAAWIISLCLISGIAMLVGILHGQTELVTVALLAEIFLVTAIDFWNNGWEHTIPLKTIAVGLIAWAAVFPVGYALQKLWPLLVIDNDFWNTPKLCVAVGMILMVMEQDTQAARRANEEYRLVFQNNPSPLWIFDRETLQLVAANRAAAELHGYTPEEFLKLNLADLLAPDLVDHVKTQVKKPSPSVNRASRHIHKDGTIIPVDILAHSIELQGRKCRFVLGTDVRERQALEEKLEYQARHDVLTGLGNRKLFEEQFPAAVAAAIQSNEMLAVLCIDVCRFKRINDLYGPAVGDECIKHIATLLSANLLSANLHGSDILVRSGGDEFTLVLTALRSAASVELIADQLRESFKQPITVQGFTIPVSFSMGVAICPDDGTDPFSLWRDVEGALRQAQSIGGGHTVWLAPALRKNAEEQIRIESLLRGNLDEAGLYLVYQPIYDFQGRACAAEALLRLDHPSVGSVSPAKFIPVAEESGLILTLGQWIIEKVCAQLRQWMDQGTPVVPIAVNISAMQIIHAGFSGMVGEILRRNQIEPKWIHLELTETAVVTDIDGICGKMRALAALGIDFSIDDFGTGHSSLGRLHQLPISTLKIDQSFVQELCAPEDGSTALSIVQAIISMAHALGQHVVAEGVETEVQLACLRELGCDLVQGFLMSRPIAASQLPELVTNRHPAFERAAQIACQSCDDVASATSSNGKK